MEPLVRVARSRTPTTAKMTAAPICFCRVPPERRLGAGANREDREGRRRAGKRLRGLQAAEDEQDHAGQGEYRGTSSPGAAVRRSRSDGGEGHRRRCLRNLSRGGGRPWEAVPPTGLPHKAQNMLPRIRDEPQ